MDSGLIATLGVSAGLGWGVALGLGVALFVALLGRPRAPLPPAANNAVEAEQFPFGRKAG